MSRIMTPACTQVDEAVMTVFMTLEITIETICYLSRFCYFPLSYLRYVKMSAAIMYLKLKVGINQLELPHIATAHSGRR